MASRREELPQVAGWAIIDTMVTSDDSLRTERSLRVLFFGLPGAFSAEVLKSLLDQGIGICGVIIPAESVSYLAVHDQPIQRLDPIPLIPLPLARNGARPADVLALSWGAEIPLFAVNNLDDTGAVVEMRKMGADVGVVACFSKRLPAAVYSLPREGLLNVHPSMLPEFRGPAPLFWQLRGGVASYGVTIHFIDEGWDTGDIVAQTTLDLLDGISGPQADILLASAGAELIGEALVAIQEGQLTSYPQPKGGGYQGNPRPADFEIKPSWTARRAFNFMRGTAEWGHPYPVQAGARRLMLSAAVGYDLQTTLDEPVIMVGGTVQIQFSSGVLVATMVREDDVIWPTA